MAVMLHDSKVAASDGFGTLFHPLARNLNCHIILNYLPHRTEQGITHAHQGKIVKKREENYVIEKGNLQEIRGFGIKPKIPIETPRSQRLRLLEKSMDFECFEEIGSSMITGPYAEYPAWDRQHQKILCRISYTEENEYAIFCRLRKLWFEWSQESERRYRYSFVDKHPQYKGYPPWKGLVQQKRQQLEQLVGLRHTIAKQFWQRYRTDLLFDFCEFFCETKPQVLKEMTLHLEDFAQKSRSILDYKWPISVGKIILDMEVEPWIPDESCRHHFDGVAITMAGLLASVIKENLQNLYSFIRNDTSFNDVSILVISVSTDVGKTNSLQECARILLQLAKMPRIEAKMFPEIAAGSMIDVTDWICEIECFQFDSTPMATKKVLRDIQKTKEKAELASSINEHFELMAELVSLKDDVITLKERIQAGRILLDQQELKSTLRREVDLLLLSCRDKIIEKQLEENKKMSELFSECSNKLVDQDVLSQLRYVVDIQRQLPILERMIEEAHLTYTHIWSFVPLTNSQIQHYFEISRLGYNLHIMLVYTWQRIEAQKDWITTKVSGVTGDHNKELGDSIKELSTVLRTYRVARRIPEVLKASNRLRHMKQRIEELKKTEILLGLQRQILQLQPLEHDVESFYARLSFWHELAGLHYKVLLHEDTTMRVHVVDLEDVDVADKTEKLIQARNCMVELSRRILIIEEEHLIYLDIVGKINTILDRFLNVLPILKALRNKGMKERHWREILQVGDSQISLPTNPMVVDLLHMHLIEKVAIIKEVNAMALKEQELEQEMDRMKHRWDNVCFTKKTVLFSTEQSHLLNFQISKTYHLMSLPAAKALMTELQEWLDILTSLRSLNQFYEKCSERWRTIEGVFSTDEMAFQLPDEYKIFKATAVVWQEITRELTADEPFMNRLSRLDYSLELLQQVMNEFHHLEAGFKTYMFTKRIIFPRFYLLSDVQLLELLSIARSPTAVKPFLPQLFANISSFEISRKGQIASTTSGNNTLLLDKPINLNWTKRHVEKWLSELDVEIKRTVRIRLKEMIEKFEYNLITPQEASNYFPQISILYYRVTVTYRVEGALRKNQLNILKDQLMEIIIQYRKECQDDGTNELYRTIGFILISSELMNMTLAREESVMINLQFAQTHLSTSALQTVETFLVRNVVFADDPLWSSQIRYYWHLENLFVRFHEVSTRFDYELSSHWSMKHLKCEKDIGNFIIWNHYGLCNEILIENNNSPKTLMTSISNVLGKPLVQLDHKPNHSKQLQGCLVLGAAAFIIANEIKEPNLWKKVSKDIERAVRSGTVAIAGNYKYTLKSEISINSSSLLVTFSPDLKRNSATCRFLEDHRYTIEYIWKMLRFYNFDDFPNLSYRIWVFLTQTESLFLNSDIQWSISDEIIENLLLKAVYLRETKGFLESEAIDTSIKLYCFSNFTNIVYGMTSALVPGFRRLASPAFDVKRNVAPYTHRKINEILNLLEVEGIVTVYGRSLSGKSHIIEEALKEYQSENDIQLLESTGSWENFVEVLNSCDSAHSGIRIDSSQDYRVLDWIKSYSKRTLCPQNFMTNLKCPKKLKIIVESDFIAESLQDFPSIIIECSKELMTQKIKTKPFLSQLTKSKLDFFEIELIDERVQALKRILPDKKFTHLIETIVLNGLMKWEELTEAYKTLKLQKDVLLGWKAANPENEGLPEVSEIEWINLLVYLGFMICETGKVALMMVDCWLSYMEIQKALLKHLSNKSICPLTIHVNKGTTREEILRYSESAKLHVFNHDTEVEPEMVLVFTFAEEASVDVFELIRCLPQKQKVIMMCKRLPSYERLYKRLIPIVRNANWKNCWKVCDSYEITRKKTREAFKIPELYDVIDKEVTRCSSAVEHFRENKKMRGTNEKEVLIVRQGRLMTSEDLITYYKSTLDILYDEAGEIPSYQQPIDPTVARLLCFIEKGLLASQNLMILTENSASHLNLEYLTSSWLPMICHLNHMKYVAFHESFESNENVIVDKWSDFVQQNLRELSLLNEKTDNEDSARLLLNVNLLEMNDDLFEEILTDVYTWTVQSGCSLRYMMDITLSDYHLSAESLYPWTQMEMNLRERLQLSLIIDRKRYNLLLKNHPEVLDQFLLLTVEELTFEAELIVCKNLLSECKVFESDEIELLIEKIKKLKASNQNVVITPLIETLIVFSKKKKEVIDVSMARYMNGLEKLRLAEEQTVSLRAELLHLQPELVRTSNQTGVLMSQIERETIEVENAREVVAANENKANQAATQAQALKAESEADLANAIPALEAAIDSLETMNQSDISALKTMRFPPYGVRLCMEAVCILLGEQPVKVSDPLGGSTYDYWLKGQKLLSDIHFLRRIREFPRDNVSNKTMRIIRDKYLGKNEFDPEVVKQCSLAAEGLCLWVNAIELYNRISKIVEPKKEKLRRAEVLVKQHMKELDAKRKALQRVTEKLQSLSDQFSQLSQKKQELQLQISNCEIRIDRAERLVAALEGEKEMWLKKIEAIELERKQLPRTCMMRTISIRLYGIEEYENKVEQTRKLEHLLFPDCTTDNDSTDVDNRTLIASYSKPMILFNDSGCGLDLVRKQFHSFIYSKPDEFPENFQKAATTGVPLFLTIDDLSQIPDVYFFQKGLEQLALYNEDTVPISNGYRLIISYPYDMQEVPRQLGQINMKLSVKDMRDKTLFAIGSKNWPVLQSEFLRISDQIEKKRKQLEEMEINMMEALGKKDDIDDENAMEMLSKTYEIKGELDGLRLELVKNKEKLDNTTMRFSSITSWATNLVMISDRLKQLNSFYIIPISELIAICDVQLFDFTEEDLNLDEIEDKLSELFWYKLRNILLREHRMIFRYILKNKCYLEKNISFNPDAMKDYSDSLDDLHQLASFIRRADSRKPLLVVREHGSLDWQRFVCEITKSCSYQFLSLLEKTSTIISQSCLKPEWIVLHMSWSEIGDCRLKNIETELRKNESAHPDFRLIFSLNFVNDAERIGCRYVQRFCLSALPHLESVIRSIFDLHHTKQAFDRLSFDCQKQFLQLICLHYGAYIRWPTVFQMDDLTYLLNLYQESIQSLIDTDQDLRSDRLYEGVVKPLYLTKLTTKHEKSILKTIFLWIFQGIGKTDDATLRKITGEQWTLDSLLVKLRHANDKLLSGYCSQFLDIQLENIRAEISLTTKFMLASGNEVCKATDKNPLIMRSYGLTTGPYLSYDVDYAEFSVRNALILEYRQAIKAEEFERVHYISSVLQSSNFSSIDVRYIQSPRRFLAKIRAQFALSKRLPLSEVEIQSWLPIMEAQNKNCQTTLKFTNCILCGARIEHGELKEYWKTEWEQQISIGIRAVKRNLIVTDEQQRKILPVLTKDGKILCNVKIRTNYPQQHWKLRGSYIKTWI